MSAMSDYLEVQIRKAIHRTTTISQRANSTAYIAGDIVYLASFDAGFYECTTAGTSAGTPPAFNTTLGQTTTDGTVTWTRVLLGLPKRPIEITLYTAAPGETGGGTEVTGGSFAPVTLDPGDANWTAASATDGLTDNAADAVFPAPTANWGIVTHFATRYRNTTNLLHYGALTTAKTVNNGDPAPKFVAGALDITYV